MCDDQVGCSAGGYSLFPRWFLTWHIYPYFSGLAALMSADIAQTYDHWSVAVLTLVYMGYFDCLFYMGGGGGKKVPLV